MKLKRVVAAMLMAVAAVVIASGCKQTVNTETVNTGTTAVAVTGIKLNKEDLSLKVDESKKLAATVMPANATNKQVTWASDKPAVATVSQDGTVTAKEEGTAQITVKTVNGGKIARCTIIVTAKDSTPTAEFTVEMTHGEHGTISANPAIPASGKIAKDTSITFTAKADTGFSVDTWTITGGEILDGTGTEGSLTAKVKITTNTTVTVSFKKISYKVMFDAKGGLPVPPAQHVLYKEKASVPTVPAKEGYDLEGWFNKDGDVLWDFTVNKVTKDTKLYAKWKTKKYAVNFNVDGGDGNLTATLNGSSFTTGKEVEYEKTVEFTAKPKEGYKVDKWSITPGSALIDGGTDGSKTAKVKITAPTTVTVSFKKISYKVTFDAKGGLPVPTEQHVLYKEKASAPIVPAKEGYDLEGWFNKDGDAPWDFTVNEVTKDTNLYAKWKAKTDTAYTVQHLQQNISGDEYTVIDTESKNGTTDTMTVAAAKNYLGFTAQAVTQQTIKADGTTIVQIKYDRHEITLTLDFTGGTITDPNLINGENGKKLLKGRYGAPVTVVDPTNTGYRFTGWNPALPATFPETGSSHTAQWEIWRTITVTGDERTTIPSGTVITGRFTKWYEAVEAAKNKVVLQSEWENGDYAVYEWRLNGKDGRKLTEFDKITGNITVYAVTNYTNFSYNYSSNGLVLKGYGKRKPRGRIIIRKNIVSIDESAFKDCTGLTGVDLSDCTKLEVIYGRAFEGCTNLTSVDLSGCIKFRTLGGLAGSAFSGCTSLTSVDLSGCTEFRTISSKAFKDCTSLTSVDLSGCIKFSYIVDSAFSGCTGLTEIRLPASLSDIEGSAFSGCTGLTSVDLSGCTSLTDIAASAFKDCTGLTEIKLPKSLTRIGPSAFQYCSRLTSAVFADTTTEWELYQGSPLYACISGHDLRDAAKAAKYLREDTAHGGYSDLFWKKK